MLSCLRERKSIGVKKQEKNIREKKNIQEYDDGREKKQLKNSRTCPFLCVVSLRIWC